MKMDTINKINYVNDKIFSDTFKHNAYHEYEPFRTVTDQHFLKKLDIVNVIFNDPATIIIWADGTKTVVKCKGEDYDQEKGFAMAIAKKALGNLGNYYETFKKWLPKNEDAESQLGGKK